MKHLLYLIIAFLCFSAEAQQTEYVDFKTAKAEIYVDFDKEEIRGSIIYAFDILKAIDSIYLNVKNIIIDYKEVNGLEQITSIINGKNENDGIFKRKFKPSINNKLTINFHVNPKKAYTSLKKNRIIKPGRKVKENIQAIGCLV